MNKLWKFETVSSGLLGLVLLTGGSNEYVLYLKNLLELNFELKIQ